MVSQLSSTFKNRHLIRDYIVDLLTRSRLEKEYVFIGVMATFLRAICANVIHVRHGAIFLAHYGRLGPTFDTCSKAIVDVLRDEGMYKNNGEVVATVVTQALQEVSHCCFYRQYVFLILPSKVIHLGS